MRAVELQRLGLDAAVAVAREGAPTPEFLPHVVRLLGADAGVGLTTFRLEPGGGVQEVLIESAGAPPFPQEYFPSARRVAVSHPGIMGLSCEDVVRLSDLVNLRRFWGSDTYELMHGFCDGRFPMAAGLHAGSTMVTFVGLHRHRSDFPDPAVEDLRQLQRPLVAAFAFRRELDRCLERLQSLCGSEPLGEGRTPYAGRPVEALCREYRPTRREAEVLALVAAGWTNRQVGRRLGITERTVRKHLGHVYEQAGLPGRAAAAVWWHDRS